MALFSKQLLRSQEDEVAIEADPPPAQVFRAAGIPAPGNFSLAAHDEEYRQMQERYDALGARSAAIMAELAAIVQHHHASRGGAAKVVGSDPACSAANSDDVFSSIYSRAVLSAVTGTSRACRLVPETQA